MSGCGVTRRFGLSPKATTVSHLGAVQASRNQHVRSPPASRAVVIWKVSGGAGATHRLGPLVARAGVGMTKPGSNVS